MGRDPSVMVKGPNVVKGILRPNLPEDLLAQPLTCGAALPTYVRVHTSH